jgi:hypothetical protein
MKFSTHSFWSWNYHVFLEVRKSFFFFTVWMGFVFQMVKILIPMADNTNCTVTLKHTDKLLADIGNTVLFNFHYTCEN